MDLRSAYTRRFCSCFVNRTLCVCASAIDVSSVSFQIEMAQKLLNSDLAELIGKMKLAQQYVMTR